MKIYHIFVFERKRSITLIKKRNNPKRPRLVGIDELLKTRENSKRTVEEYIKEHPDEENLVRDKLKKCLCDNLFRYKICDKRPLQGAPGLYHFKISGACVVSYSVVYCEDLRYKPVVDIERISPINKGHGYKKQVKNRKMKVKGGRKGR